MIKYRITLSDYARKILDGYKNKAELARNIGLAYQTFHIILRGRPVSSRGVVAIMLFLKLKFEECFVMTGDE